jgi:hypothetical protein
MQYQTRGYIRGISEGEKQMNETSFWQLIDQAGSQEEPNEWLREF